MKSHMEMALVRVDSRVSLHTQVLPPHSVSFFRSLTFFFHVCLAANEVNGYWQVMGAHGVDCKGGEKISNGSVIRLMHTPTGRNLHSHQHTLRNLPPSCLPLCCLYLSLFICTCLYLSVICLSSLALLSFFFYLSIHLSFPPSLTLSLFLHD